MVDFFYDTLRGARSLTGGAEGGGAVDVEFSDLSRGFF